MKPGATGDESCGESRQEQGWQHAFSSCKRTNTRRMGSEGLIPPKVFVLAFLMDEPQAWVPIEAAQSDIEAHIPNARPRRLFP